MKQIKENRRCQLFSFNCGNKRLQLYDWWMELFDQPVNGNIRGYDNIQNITLVSGDKYKTDCLLDYTYFQENNKLNAKDLSKQETFDADPKAIQQINFIGCLDIDEYATVMTFFIEEVKKTILDFPQGTLKVL